MSSTRKSKQRSGKGSQQAGSHVNKANKQLQSLERQLQKLEATPDWKRDADSVWSVIKEVASDLYAASKDVLKDLGLEMGDAKQLLALL